ncbi:hypothetical protein G7Z17_g8112 [Cylindrodendrum hubeiense]|uniref:F-box domain-containing protein n=1 Tax=Cylindrodendrum hubeiense TaxID=595255 RepID=A0A9P5H7Q5_9HYPO|nr:hypothetical protein G7Z17_g8112 [Cylindrodendrum hubeiense]
MQQEPLAIPAPVTHPGVSSTTPSSQHGPIHRDPNGLHRIRSGGSSGGSQNPGSASRRDSHDDVDVELLDEELRGLSLGGHDPAPGYRISEYENAMTPPTPKRALGFKVIKRSEPLSDGLQLEEFPNEILTHILSHLHSDSHAAIALVSKRFYALITSSHAWRMAFLRYFPGHQALESKVDVDIWTDASSDFVRSEARYFSRLTPLASWRKEYLLRTRLLRNLARGKPGSSGVIGSSVRGGKKLSAVLTYNSKLPWAVTNIHAVFSNGKKPPRAIHGASDLGVGSISDPTSGKLEKWGLPDPFSAMQLDEVFPGLVPYGLGDGPAATPNVMDVSQPYGIITGEGFPGGRPYYRSVQENRGRYLDSDTGVVDTYPDIPKIPEMSEAICIAWLAKSSAVPLNTQSMAGMLTGSTLGIVTSYAIVCDSNNPRHSTGDITARWVLSPGVPIIALKIDDNYSQKRRSLARVWAVALNALGEVYYLTEVPVSSHTRSMGEDVTKNAWYAGRSVSWHLLESTRRVARPDDLDKNATRGAYSPRSPSNSMNLSKGQMVAEAREIEKFLRHKPAHFRRVCDGWDMQRKLEVDFANDDGNGAGETIFVIDCGLAEDRPARVQRYSRTLVAQEQVQAAPVETPSPPQPEPSLFGSVDAAPVEDTETAEAPKLSPPEPSPTTTPSDLLAPLHEWDSCTMELKGQDLAVISSSALDSSSNALLTLVEDPLFAAEEEIPGRRSRLLAVGTDNGAVLVWNARAESKDTGIKPDRFIQTESPEVSCLAITGLYLVHGGSDGLVQAWDPLASTLDPIRTVNARSNGRIPRHMTTMNPGLDEDTYSAVRAIYLDPDPTVLRGIVSFGAFLRYWAYSSTSHSMGRKRRLKHSDFHGRPATTRRQGGDVSDYIAAEEAELRHEEQHMAREQARLRSRFGVGALGDLTEEEALRYAQMVSEETFLDEQRRTSDSAADASLDTASTFSETTVDTLTPEPSVTDTTPPTNSNSDAARPAEVEDEYEQQIQQAIRLSLMEGVNETDNVQSPPPGNSSGEYEFAVSYKTKPSKKNKQSGPGSPRGTQAPIAGSSTLIEHYDDDLELALKLSLADQGISGSDNGLDVPQDEYPPLETEGVGKGKGVQRW